MRYFYLLLLLLPGVVRAEVPVGNFWPNATFESRETLEVVTGTPTGWRREGSDPTICQVSTARSVSATHSLSINDANAAGYGEWFGEVELSAGFARGGDDLDLHWHEMFNISGGEMRLTLLFMSQQGIRGERHFLATGQSAGWAGTVEGSPFVARNERVRIPEGTLRIRFSLVSGGSEATTGVMMIDDLSVVRRGNPVLLANNFWHNPSFELGENLDQPNGTVTNWNRGGNNPALCEITATNSVSPTHSLMVNDTDSSKYAEWYSDFDLTGHAVAGDELDVQWFQIFSASGEMRLTILFFNEANNVTGTFHFTVQGDSPGYIGTVEGSSFRQRIERIPVAAGAVKMRVSLVSGGSESVTGF